MAPDAAVSQAFPESPCPCRSCRGRKCLSPRSIRRHVKTYGKQRRQPTPIPGSRDGPAVARPVATRAEPRFRRCTTTRTTTGTSSRQGKKKVGRNIRPHDVNPKDGKSGGDAEFQFSPDLLKPIYKGCKLTLVDVILKVMELYSNHPGMSQSAVSGVLKLIGKVLPKGHIIPASYRQARSLLHHHLCPELRIDTCRDGHVLYYGATSGLQECPTCKEPRSSAKQYVYLPLIPRLRKMLATGDMLKDGSKVRATGGRKLDVQDAPIWRKHMEMQDGEEQEVVRVALAASIDGFCPFNIQKNTYSMTPVLISILNSQPSDRNKTNKTSHILLSSIIPGPSAPSDTNPYLAPLVDELKQLHEGVDAQDSSGRTVKLQARLLMGVYDNPGIAKVLKSAGVNAISGACRHCEQQGTYTAGLSKVVYVDNRRFLPAGHQLRKRKRGFCNSGKEERQPPAKRLRKDQLEAGRKIAALQTQGKNTSRLEKETGQKGLEEFARLPYFEEVAHPVEPMHTIQVVIKKFLGLLTGKDLSQKLLSFESTRRSSDELRSMWTLSASDKKAVDERLAAIRVPHGYPWTPKGMFVKMGYMKSAELLHLCTDGILKYALRGMLPVDQRTTFFKLLTCLQQICSPLVGDLAKLRLDVHESLALLERDWPLGIQTLCTHLLHHIVDSVEECGPVQGFWMFPFERMLGFLGKRIQNRRDPEITAVETYRVYELSRMWDHATSHRGKSGNGTTGQNTATNVNPFRNFYATEGHGRTNCDSSCVAVRDVPHPRFGRIQGISNTVATVAWYGKTQQDDVSGLLYVDNSSTSGSTDVPVTVLPPPVITATEGHRIWFLNVKLDFLP